ncbi:hypothetical protein JCM19301_23 [Jejuia pallidilutea]|uniref:Uncharacterized protein n=1 Tax=Jejuia pallidilutea TaxID=504487 RepID=A0A090VV36_9FLAO|nr:hypothetical protein JCM19301_23 [Jejuia pallidilutea]
MDAKSKLDILANVRSPKIRVMTIIIVKITIIDIINQSAS